MALTDYSIDTSSPESIKRQRAYAEALSKEGNDYSPIASPWQGAARLAQGLIGGYQRGQADQQEQAGRGANQQRLAQLAQTLQGGGKIDPAAMVSFAGDPWSNPASIGAINNVATMQRQEGRDKIADQHWSADYALKKANAEKESTPTNVAEYEYYKKNFAPSEKQAAPLDYTGFLSAKKAGMGTDSAYSPELLNSLTDRLEAGDTSWKTGMARIPGLIKAVEENSANRGAARRAADPEVKPAQDILQNRANQAGRVKEQSTLGTASANNSLYGNVAAATMQTAIEKSAAVDRTRYVPINKLLQTAQTAISDPALAELRTATNTLVNDYAKATTPVGVPTDAKAAHARELLDLAMDHTAYEKVVRLMHREIENTHRGIEFTKKQLQSGKGGDVPPIDKPSQGSGGDSMLQQARDAIAKGAPRDKVLERLKAAGVDAGAL